MNSYQHTVKYYETDRMGVTHHSNYVRWMEEARIDYLDQIGWSYQKLEAEGMISPVTALECKYRQSTTFPDTIWIDVSVEEFRGIRLKLSYTMRNEQGDVVFTGTSEHCFVDQEGKIVRLGKRYPDFCRLLQQLAEDGVAGKEGEE